MRQRMNADTFATHCVWWCATSPDMHHARRLEASIFVDRESLQSKNEAQILIRAQLLLNGASAPLSLLKHVHVAVECSLAKGSNSRKEFADVKLDDASETCLAFTVPAGLRSVAIALSGKVRSLLLCLMRSSPCLLAS